jgi:hypothetical protein
MALPPIASFVENANEEQGDLEIEMPGSSVVQEDILPEGLDIQIEEDGGVVIDFDPFADMKPDEGDFYRNLAEEMSETEMGTLSSTLLGDLEANKASRGDWETAYANGLELLGFNYEERTQPFRGATGVTHPLLAEAATQFQAQAFNELLPAGGPVRTIVMGDPSREKEAQAHRVKDFMNYYITSVMEEYTPEFDQMLFYLPLAGSTFKKVYYDEALGRAVSRFVPAENLVVPYDTADLDTCPNITHISRMSMNDLRKLQVSGFYRDVAIHPSQSPQTDSSSITKEMDYIEGVEPSNIDYDCTLVECHVDLDLEGFEDTDSDGEPTGIKVPYIVTISEDNGQVLAIRRNYKEDDPLQAKIQYFVHYKFLPGFGFYGLGLIHTIGGLSRTATAALRQLIDAGTLSNLPAGFKARGLRIRDDADPLQPGEFRDVDAPGGTIRESLMPLPFKGPDQTLFNLLGFVVDAANRFATITDLKMGNGDQGAPVGTTMAMMEQGSRVMSAVHKRLHYAMRQEFTLLAQVMRDYLPQEYPYTVENANRSIMAEDFDSRVDIIPLSNPNVFSQSQRILLAQTQMELAAQAPELHNPYEAFRRMYEALGVRDIDKILKPPSSDEPVPKDPAQENIDSLENTQLRAFDGQDHDAHIMAHLVFGSSPMVGALPPVAVALQKHVMDHAKIKAEETAVRMVIEQNQGQMPTEDMQEMIEAMVAQLIAQEMQNIQALSAQIAGGGEEQQVDPLVALKQQELAIKAQQVEANIAQDQAEHELDTVKVQERARQFDERLASQQDMGQDRIDAAYERELLRLRAKERG